MSKYSNATNRLDALRAAAVAGRAVSNLSRQSVQQDVQIDNLIERLVTAAETIKREQLEAIGARKLADKFCQERNALYAKLDGLVDLIDRLHGELQDEARHTLGSAPEAFTRMFRHSLELRAIYADQRHAVSIDTLYKMSPSRASRMEFVVGDCLSERQVDYFARTAAEMLATKIEKDIREQLAAQAKRPLSSLTF